jgi:dipeptidyl aminopeptidase/acylaminoacyl peptidase
MFGKKRSKAEVVQFTSDNIKLVGVVTEPGKKTDAVVLMAHGGPGGDKRGPSEIFVKLADALALAGIASLRFDFRGCGESAGEFTETTIEAEARDLVAAAAYARGRGFRRVGVVGESLGGTVAILAYDEHWRAVVLWFPAVYLMETTLTDFLKPEAQAELQSNGYVTAGTARVGRAFIEEFQDLDVERRLSEFRSPTLFVHGDADKDVPHDQSLRAAQRLTAKHRVEIIPGGGHGLRKPTEQERTAQLTVAWFKKHL